MNESARLQLRGYFRLPGTGTLVKFGGFVKTDVFVDTNQAGSYYGGYVPSSFPETNYHISNYATGNIIVQPSQSYLFGAEYVYGSLERKNGFKWVAPRVQVSVTYHVNRYPKE